MIPVRHLVLESRTGPDGHSGVLVGCTESGFVPYDRDQHTFLTAQATCTDCRAVHAAWCVVFHAALS